MLISRVRIRVNNFWSSCVVFTEEERGQKRKRELDEEGEEDED